MPTFVHGKSTHFEIDDTGGTSRDISDTLTSVDFPETIETAETTAFGSTYKSYIVGLRDATISVSGIWDATVDGYFIGTEPATRSFIYGPAGDTAGNVKYTGEAILTSFSVSNPVGDVVTYSADFQCTGGVTRTTF
ncbi:MAG: phage tail tube protein [Ilumatobacteraceae bacterium]